MKRIKFTILFFYLALFIGLALYDEQPDPVLLREMARPQPEIIEPGNVFVVFFGFSSPEGVSPYDYGAEKLRKIQEAISAGKSYRDIYTAINDSKSQLSIQGDTPYFYDRPGGCKCKGILAYAAAHADVIAAYIDNNRELLRRYESLRTFPRYNEPIDGFVAGPFFVPLRNAQRIRQLHLATMASQGDIAGALSGLRADAEFGRFIARNSKTFISKLIIFSYLKNDMRFAAELGAYCKLNKQALAMVRDILRPFDNGETSLVGALRGEVRYSMKSLELWTWPELKKWRPDRLFIKRHVTGNRVFAYLQEFILLAELPPRQFADEFKRRKANKRSSPRVGLPFLYNSAGEALAIVGIPDIPRFIEKGHNLEGLRRLSLLKVLSHQENIAPERMQLFLNSHAAELGNPYTGVPMIWDLKKSSISFKDISGVEVSM